MMGLQSVRKLGKRLLKNPHTEDDLNPSAWGLLKPSSYCDVGRFFYMVFKF
jgi:hypothetical protein